MNGWGKSDSGWAYQQDDTYLHIETVHQKFHLMDRSKSPFIKIGEYPTLEAAKMAYIVARSIGIGAVIK
jgi:hypothetical protein